MGDHTTASDRTDIIAVLAVLFAVAALATASFSYGSDAAPAGDFVYEYSADDDSVAIVGYTGSGGEIKIPDSVPKSILVPGGTGSCYVTAIGDGAFAGSPITKVTGGENVETIGKGAFQGCSGLEYVEMLHTDGLVLIGESAFAGTSVIPSLPETLTRIGDRAFEDSGADAFIVPPNAVLSELSLGYPLYNEDGTEPVDGAVGGRLYSLVDGKMVAGAIPGRVYAHYGVYYTAEEKAGQVSLVATGGVPGTYSIEIPASFGVDEGSVPVSGVGKEAFMGSDVAYVTIHAPEIGYKAFARSHVQELAFDGGIIDEFAFYGCPLLRSASIGGESGIDRGAFAECKALYIMTFGKVTYLDSRAFNGLELKDNGEPMFIAVTTISNSKLLGSCGTLYKIQEEFAVDGIVYGARSSSEAVVIGFEPGVIDANIGATVVSPLSKQTLDVVGIGLLALTNSDIRTLTYGGTGSIDMGALNSCRSLSEVNLSQIEKIDKLAFIWDPLLKSIALPEGLKSVGEAAFAGGYLEYIEIPSTIRSLGSEALTSLPIYSADGSEVVEQTAANLAGRTLVKQDGRMMLLPADGDRAVIDGVIYEITMQQDHLVSAIGAVPGTTSIVIPMTIEFGGADYRVGEVADRAFYGNTEITSAVIGADVGNRAFCKCTNLEDLVLDGCANVAECAFYGCGSLARVDFDSYTVYLGDKAFANCGALERMSFEDCWVEMGINSLYGIKFYDGTKALSKTSHNLSERRFIGSGSVLVLDLDEFSSGGVLYKPYSSTEAVAVGYEGEIRSASIYEFVYDGQTRYDVLGVAQRAFYGCGTLMDLVCDVPIGERAFANCSSLSVVEAYSCPYLGEYAFYKCPIQSLAIGAEADGLEISRSAFSECRSFQEIELGELSFLGANAFYGNVFYAPDAVTRLSHSIADLSERSFVLTDGKLVCLPYDGYRFVSGGVEYSLNLEGDSYAIATGHAEGIKKAVIKDHVSIGDRTYWVQGVGSKAFYGCGTLEELVVEVDVGYKAFANCTSLRSLTLGSEDLGVSLGDYAFYGCTGLERAEIHELYEIGKLALERIKFYDGNTLLEKNGEALSGKTFVGSGSILRLQFDPFYMNGVEYTPISSWQALVTGRLTDATELFILDTTYDEETMYHVYGIADRAFYKDQGIVSVTYIGLGTIGDKAFAGCPSLESALMLGMVDGIGEYAFYGCKSLREVSMWEPLKSIGRSAFSGCTGLESIGVPESVTSVGENAFYGLSLYYADRTTPMPLGSVPGHTLESFGYRALAATEFRESDVFEYEGLRYLITSEIDSAVTLHEAPAGDLEIPSCVMHGDKEYAVTSIGAGALKDGYELVVPSTVKTLMDASFTAYYMITFGSDVEFADPDSISLKLTVPGGTIDVHDGLKAGTYLQNSPNVLTKIGSGANP